MDHRSRNVTKTSNAHTYNSLHTQPGQRGSNTVEWQQFVGNSLEQELKNRTGNSPEVSQGAGFNVERQQRTRTGQSMEGQPGGGGSSDQHQGGNSRLAGVYLDGNHKRAPKDGKESPKKSKHQNGPEKKVEELRTQLEEERQTSRRTIGRLQRDLARLKSERAHNQRDGREGVVKELEKERMLRVDTEQRLHDMRVESDSCRSRLHALQGEFKKMEEMVRDMLQYKSKIDQLKQEKANLAVTYENSLQKCRNHIGNLERENMMLLNQVKKMESQIHGKGDDRDKSRLLLERLKMVEAENSGLVLENEQQRQQYEKCLDQIANQVVQALLAQKTLREECMKLQSRVQDLELQNRQLNLMFQQRIRFPSDPTMQHMPCGSGSTYVYQAEAGQGEVTSAQFLQGSAVSLQSTFSEPMYEDAPGQPQMSTPPPWLRDRLEVPLDDDLSLSSFSTGSSSPPSHAAQQTAVTTAASKLHHSPGSSSAPCVLPSITTKIETEFPATNSSPKMKHVNVYERDAHPLERKTAGSCPLVSATGSGKGSTGSVRKGKVKSNSDSQPVNQLSEQAWKKLEAQVKNHQKSQVKITAASEKNSSASPQEISQTSPGRCFPTSSADSSRSKTLENTPNMVREKAKTAPNAGEKKLYSAGKPNGNGGVKLAHTAALLGKVKLRRKGSTNSRDSSQSPHRQAVRNSMPPSLPFHSQYYYDYSDEDSDSRPVSRVYSSASTISLSELLDTSGEGDFTLDDDFFSDWSSMCLSPQHRLPIHPTNQLTQQASQMQGSLLVQQQQCRLAMPGSTTLPDSKFHCKFKSQGLSPLAKMGTELRTDLKCVGPLGKEREDSGCEVGTGQSERKDISESNIPQNIHSESGAQTASDPSTQTEECIQTCAAHVDAHSGKTLHHADKNSSPASTAAANELQLAESCAEQVVNNATVVCTMSVSSKSATHIQLPFPQAAVLMDQPVLRDSESEHSFSSQSSCAVSPDKSPSLPLTAVSQASEAEKEDPASNSSLKTSASDLPFSSDLITSVISQEAFGCTPKLKSQPLSAQEKSRACRPDQLILAPSDKNFSVHGFTSSSSSSSEDKSLVHLAQLHSVEETPLHSLKTASITNAIESPSGNSRPKKTPPPVPHKPCKPNISPDSFTSIAKVELSAASANSSSGVSDVGSNISSGSVVSVGSIGNASVGGNSASSGIGGDTSNSSCRFPPETTLTVGFMSVEPQQLDHVSCNPDSVRNFVNSLVKDLKERVARNSDWPITSTMCTTITTATRTTCKSLDSSFESLRAEKSGSKDDGYSTMSSDIHPVVMDKYAYPENLAKPGQEMASSTRKTSDVHDYGKAESLKRRDRSVEMSETDSAMETSAHSMDTRNSSQSLSSQVSSSSGDNVISPGAKVASMARFFEDEVVKRSGCSTTTQHIRCVSTPSPLSPSGCSSVDSPDGSLCGNISTGPNDRSAVTSPEWNGPPRQPDSIMVSHSCTVHVTSATSASVCSLSSCTASSSVGQKIQDLVQNFKAGLNGSTDTVTSHSLSSSGHAHKPSDFRFPEERSGSSVRTAFCDFSKYEITDLSKLNVSSSPDSFSAVRRETITSWPPAKTSSSSSAPACSVSRMDSPACHQSSGWEAATSPLHIEDKPLDDIPEESGDEGDNLCVCSVQDPQQPDYQQQQYGRDLKSASSCSGLNLERSVFKKAMSESSLDEKPHAASLYDEMASGNWDSGKMLERSASVSEMDFRSGSICIGERGLLLRNFCHFSFDEDNIRQKVTLAIGKPACSDQSDSEAESKKQLNYLWNSLTPQQPRNIPEWHPKETLKALKQLGTPSPMSVQKVQGNSNPDEWLLSFSKDEIDCHTGAKSCGKQLFPDARTQTAVHVNAQDLSTAERERNYRQRSSYAPSWDLSLSAKEDVNTQLQIQCGNSEDGESSDCSPRSPSEEQKLFHREFYSLCLVGSNRSLASSNCSVYERSAEHLNEISGSTPNSNSFQARLPHPSQIVQGIHSREFDEISNQIASLSRTVDELNHSLNSLNSDGSGDSGQDVQQSGLAGESQGAEASEGAWAANKQECMEGYHWVEDEFYLTTYGGEVIIGSAALLAEEEGMDDYCIDGAGEEGGMFKVEDNDDAIADDAQDDFYCIRMPPKRSRKTGSQPTRPVSGGSDADHILNNLVQFRYNSDGQLSREQTGSIADSVTALGVGWNMESSSSHSNLSQVLPASNSGRSQIAGDDNLLADRERRADLLDSMLVSGGDSNDSLSSDIGLDHMMCQRLMGRKGKMEVVRFSLPKQRPSVDLPQFFIRYSKPEQDAVAAFDFLEDISTSESNENLETADGTVGLCRSSSQPLSREVLMRRMQARQKQDVLSFCRSSRPLSDSDFLKYRLCQGQHEADGSHQPVIYGQLPEHSYQPHQGGENNRRKYESQEKDGVEGKSGLHASCTPPQRRHKLRRRRKKSESKDKSQERKMALSGEPDTEPDGSGGKRLIPRLRKVSRLWKGGDKSNKAWQDTSVNYDVGSTLSPSDESCCGESSSCPSSPTFPHRQLPGF